MIEYHGGKFQDQYLKEYLLSDYAEILSSGSHLQSKWISEFENRLTSRFDIKYAVAVGSCTDALLFALLAVGVGPNDVIIAPAFSFIASVSAAKKIGARVLFVDVDADGSLDYLKLSELSLKNVKALIYVHMYGYVSPKAIKIQNFCRQNNIFMIEDAAQAFDAKINDVYAGAIGDIGVISFDPTKVIAAPGSGGVLLTNNLQYSSMAKRLRYHGKDAAGNFVESGYNSQMSSFTASTLIRKIKNNKAAQKRRSEVAILYLKYLPIDMTLSIYKEDESRHSYHKFVIHTNRRDELKEYLSLMGVQTAVHYSPILPLHPSLYDRDEVVKNFPVATNLSKTVLSLPIYDALSNQDVIYIANEVSKFYD